MVKNKQSLVTKLRRAALFVAVVLVPFIGFAATVIVPRVAAAATYPVNDYYCGSGQTLDPSTNPPSCVSYTCSLSTQPDTSTNPPSCNNGGALVICPGSPDPSTFTGWAYTGNQTCVDASQPPHCAARYTAVGSACEYTPGPNDYFCGSGGPANKVNGFWICVAGATKVSHTASYNCQADASLPGCTTPTPISCGSGATNVNGICVPDASPSCPVGTNTLGSCGTSCPNGSIVLAGNSCGTGQTGAGTGTSQGNSASSGSASSSNSASSPTPAANPSPTQAPSPTTQQSTQTTIKPTATSQSSKPNPIPEASSQGTAADQPQLTPSPFYDGNEYSPGSAADPLGIQAKDSGLHSAANTTSTTVTILVVIVLIGGVICLTPLRVMALRKIQRKGIEPANNQSSA